MYPVVEWKNDKVYMIDQRYLPLQEIFIEHADYQQVAKSIKDMVVRGAPAIGVSAAMGIALGVMAIQTAENLEKEFKEITGVISATRPTAVNLFWAVERMEKVFQTWKHDLALLKEKMKAEAIAIDLEDVEINKKLGANGQVLLKSDQTILTHCNAGALATAGYGTALGVIRAAVENGKNIRVMADETRPYLQGARLTVWELQKDNIPVTLITDNMAGYMMAQGRIDGVIVGADRIAGNGDTANKIGTYSVAILANYHKIPFYVAAPVSTIDFSLESGKQIPIEERCKEEVIHFMNQQTALTQTEVCNPAFDVTPNHLISAIITEKKVLYPVFKEAIDSLR
ncbi:MAG: S-methyl-5-thioribose-1-phosphate isomerase [Acidobacteria bacterium]|jgi:methylthioribose-1-phosphate isomerase|nr:S-methyl-5-thioribose-1-phosphate isomerase [Acidobacteriota bacterium]